MAHAAPRAVKPSKTPTAARPRARNRAIFEVVFILWSRAKSARRSGSLSSLAALLRAELAHRLRSELTQVRLSESRRIQGAGIRAGAKSVNQITHDRVSVSCEVTSSETRPAHELIYSCVGAIARDREGSCSEAFNPARKAIMPLAISSIRSEILPRLPNSKSPTTARIKIVPDAERAHETLPRSVGLGAFAVPLARERRSMLAVFGACTVRM